MRIAYVVDAWPRLSETFVVREIAAVAAAHDVRVLALTRGDATAADPAAAALGPRVAFLDDVAAGPASALLAGLRAPVRTGRATAAARRARAESGLRRLPALLAVAQAWRAWGVERVHAHFARWATAAAEVLAAATGAPFGFTAHAYDLFASPERLDDKARRAAWAVTCTEAARAEIERRHGPDVAARFVVVRHGVDLGVYRPLDGPRPPGALRVLAVGRLVEKKGFSDLVDALARLRAHRVDVVAEVVGDGPLRSELEARAGASALPTEALAFVGARPPDAVRERMRGWADVLVAPSVVTADGDRDGIPNVVGEALACGVPVVGTTVGGIPELVVDGTSGLLVPPHAPDALAHALARLVGDAGLRGRLRVGARRVAEERFDAAGNVAAFLRVVEAGGRG